MFDHLLSPTSIGSLRLRNRLVMASMGVEIVGDDGKANEGITAYYEERAKGGVGLIITEVCAMDWPRGANSLHQLGLSNDSFIAPLRTLTDRVHAHDGKIAIQLVQHGKVSRVDIKEGRDVLIPSTPEWHGSYDMVPDLTADELAAMAAVNGDGGARRRVMTTDDIAEVTDKFAAAARRARDAGFDGIEIHGAHGYLLSGFLSKAWNNRDDEYGGSIENRSRFLIEVITACRSAVDDEIPVWCRLDAREYRTPKGIEFKDCRVTARLAQEAGAAAIHLSAYGDSTSASAFTEGTLPHAEAKHADLSAQLKIDLDIPVIGVGRIRPEVGDQMIADGKADLIAMGRQMLADPFTAKKLIEARPDDIRPCINCYVCVASPFFDRRVGCAVNPVLSHEDELAGVDTTRATHRKHVAIVGGGPAGLEAARVAAGRGHRVTLFEASGQLGGSLRFAALVYAPNRRLLAWLTSQVEKLGVDVRLKTEATPARLLAIQPEAIIVATGGARERCTIPGADQKHVLDGDDLRAALTGSGDGNAKKLPMLGRIAATAGRTLGITDDPERLAQLTKVYMPISDSVAIIGGGLVGIEMAEFLVERGRTVTVLEVGPTMAVEMAHPRRWRVLTDLRDHGATLVTDATVTSITADSVQYKLADESVSEVAAEAVVIATGLVGNPELGQWQSIAGIEPQIIGDATGIGYIEGAIHDGFHAALAVG